MSGRISFTNGWRLGCHYWAFYLGLALWLLLFLALTSSPETYQTIAAFCGLR